MRQWFIRTGLLALMCAGLFSAVDQSSAEAAGRHRCAHCRNVNHAGNQDLFYNFYAMQRCGGNPAQLYVSPLPVPQHVGLTYITYQPMMPHHFLYRHHRTYHRYYNNGRGMTRTSVRWR